MLTNNHALFLSAINQGDRPAIALTSVNGDVIPSRHYTSTLNEVFCESLINTNALYSPQSAIHNFLLMFQVLIDTFGIITMIDSLKIYHSREWTTLIQNL